MADDTGTVTATCTAHEPPIEVHVEDKEDDASRVFCPECNQEFGTWGDVKKKMVQAAKDQIYDELIKPLENNKFIKITKG
jgi:hypothetical protein